jgi:hypothetical protein
MPYIEMTLSTAFTRNVDPWLTILETTTTNPWLLSSTPIIVVKDGIASQVVYSALPFKPWGITPVCVKCKSLVKANVSGHGDKFQNHEKLVFKCTQMGCGEKTSRTRPGFVHTIDNRPFFFFYQFPLTAEQCQELGSL